MNSIKADFIGRLIVPTLLIGAALWYWTSLWDARMREQNLILIQPVVLIMIPCYLAVLVYEVRRFRRQSAVAPNLPHVLAPGDQGRTNHLQFMGVAVLSVGLFWLAGAIVATLAMIFFGMLVLGVRRTRLLVAVPSISTLILWLVFSQGFGIRMPLFTFL